MPLSDQVYLSFDDLTVLPRRNQGAADGVDLTSRVSRSHTLSFPLVSAAMPTITGASMAIAMGQFGGLGVVHRFASVEEQRSMLRQVVDYRPDLRVYPQASVTPAGHLLGAASVSPGDVERAKALADAGAQVLFLDTPNPTNDEVFDGASKIRQAVSTELVVGSVVDGETTRRYIDLGVDGIKVGLGSGAMCSMRRTTGVGVPQVSALSAVVDAAGSSGVAVISDGAARCGGDIVKALALGATAVMLGSMLAGCDETPPPTREVNGQPVKELAGLRFGHLEIEAPTGYPKVDEYLKAHDAPRIEGGDQTVPCTGPCHLRLLGLARSVRSGVHMAGGCNVPELTERARLVRVSGAGGAEAYVAGRPI